MTSGQTSCCSQISHTLSARRAPGPSGLQVQDNGPGGDNKLGVGIYHVQPLAQRAPAASPRGHTGSCSCHPHVVTAAESWGGRCGYLPNSKAYIPHLLTRPESPPNNSGIAAVASGSKWLMGPKKAAHGGIVKVTGTSVQSGARAALTKGSQKTGKPQTHPTLPSDVGVKESGVWGLQADIPASQDYRVPSCLSVSASSSV